VAFFTPKIHIKQTKSHKKQFNNSLITSFITLKNENHKILKLILDILNILLTNNFRYLKLHTSKQINLTKKLKLFKN
jgi:hypothetical protein